MAVTLSTHNSDTGDLDVFSSDGFVKLFSVSDTAFAGTAGIALATKLIAAIRDAESLANRRGRDHTIRTLQDFLEDQ